MTTDAPRLSDGRGQALDPTRAGSACSPQGSNVGPPPSDEATESLRRLARALIVSAMEAYALQRTAEPSIALSTAVVSRPADRPVGIYNRRRKRWGRAA